MIGQRNGELMFLEVVFVFSPSGHRKFVQNIYPWEHDNETLIKLMSGENKFFFLTG